MKIDSAAVLAAPRGAPTALPYPLRQVDARPGGPVAPNGSLLDATGRSDGVADPLEVDDLLASLGF